ncbi:MAG: hypothetical protein RIT81_30400 [Deltaproteobacteria bacterium]
MRRAVGVIGIAAAACGDPGALVLELPALDGHASMLLAARDDDVVQLTAIDLSRDRDAPSNTFPYAGRDLDLDALLYEAPLDTLRIRPGEVEAVEGGRPLPEATTLLSARIVDGATTPWEETVQLDASLESFRIESPCAAFDAELFALTSTGGGGFVVPISDRAVLVGTDARDVFRIDVETSAVTPVTRSIITPLSAVADPVGPPTPELLLASARGEVLRGVVVDESLELEVLSTHPENLPIDAIAGDPASGPVFVLSEAGVFDRYHDGTWSSTLYDFGTDASVGAVARMGPDAAVAVWPSEDRVVRYVAGEVLFERIQDDVAMRNAATIPGFGTVVGSTLGALFRFEDGAWRALPPGWLRRPVQRIAPYAGGFVYGGPNGNFGQYLEGFGHCELAPPGGGNVEHIATVGETVVVAFDGVAEIASVAILRPRR